MEEPIYVIDHMIVMGIDPEKTSYFEKKNAPRLISPHLKNWAIQI